MSGALNSLERNRAKDYKRIKDIWDDEPPTRIAIAALLWNGYTYQQSFRMMHDHYKINEDEFWRIVKLYSLKELEPTTNKKGKV